MAKFSDVILTDSKCGKEQFIESYRDVMNKKIRVYALPFVAPPHIWDSGEEYIETPPRYVFYPAQFWRHKNHINLIKAIGLVKEKVCPTSSWSLSDLRKMPWIWSGGISKIIVWKSRLLYMGL